MRWRKCEKLGSVAQKCFATQLQQVGAEYNPAADLSSALEVHQSNHFPFLKADEIPDFLRALEGYTGSKLVQIATKFLLKG